MASRGAVSIGFAKNMPQGIDGEIFRDAFQYPFCYYGVDFELMRDRYT